MAKWRRVTVDDWIFAIETLANKDYEGPRYSNVKDIEGAPATMMVKRTILFWT